MIEERTAKRYLAWASEIKQSNLFFDAHAHPFELFYGIGQYRRHQQLSGVYSTDPTPLEAPRVTDLLCSDDARAKEIYRLFTRPGMAPRNLARLYMHTGPGIFEMHMDMCGIDRTLLLPVARPQDDINHQMCLMDAMFGGNERFSFGWCVPASVPDELILPAAEDALHRFRIRAVKLHPNLMEINLQSGPGKRRVETMLHACGRLGLPMIVHGGRSRQLGVGSSSCYALVKHIKNIDWSVSESPVVISHAGAYGCEPGEVEETLQELQPMLSNHANMLVDISGLEVGTLAQALMRLDPERIIFGSDMLYESPWAAVVRLLLAIEKTTACPEETFIRIASTNPQKYLFTNTIDNRKRGRSRFDRDLTGAETCKGSIGIASEGDLWNAP